MLHHKQKIMNNIYFTKRMINFILIIQIFILFLNIIHLIDSKVQGIQKISKESY